MTTEHSWVSSIIFCILILRHPYNGGYGREVSFAYMICVPISDVGVPISDVRVLGGHAIKLI